MFDISKFGSISDTGDFVGDYVVDMKNLILAATIARIHAIVEGDPGCGKTDIPSLFASRVYPDNFLFVQCEPTKEPGEMKGIQIYKLFAEGINKRNTDGTPFDPKFRIIMLDDMPRLNNPALDVVLHVMNPKMMPPNYNPVFIASANWIPKDKRSEATFDRFGLYMKVKPSISDWVEVCKAQLKSKGRSKDIGGGIPDAQTVDEIRNEFYNLTERASNAVADLCGGFLQMMETGLQDDDGKSIRQFKPNQRRSEIMTSAIAALSVYHTGSNDFDAIPAEAKKILRYCYITSDDDIYQDWVKFVNAGTTDPIEALVAQIFGNIRNSIVAFEQANTSTDRLRRSSELGVKIINSRDELRNGLVAAGVANFEDNQVYKDVMVEIDNAFARVAQGKSAF